VYAFRAHNAPLGIAFLRSPAHSDDYRGAAVVALHGSWNRSTKDGYKVVSLHWSADGSIEARDFLWGFLEGDHVVGRPAEVAEDADGNVYVSDDYANAVYRVTPGGAGTARAPPGRVASAGTAGDDLVVDEATRAAGAARYEALACGSCHRAAGDEPLPEGRVVLAGLSTRYSVESMIAFLSRPPPPMPPVTADAQSVDALARYLLVTY
jgi:cytochrome c553